MNRAIIAYATCLAESPRVSVVLIFEGNAPLLRTCVRDLYEKIATPISRLWW